jgi:hypothetical protein
MAFLLKSDFLTKSREDNIDTITGGDDSLLQEAQLEAISEISSYLSNRYELAGAFPDLFQFSALEGYEEGVLIYLSADPLPSDPTTATVGSLVSFQGNVFRVLTAAGTPITNAGNYDLVGVNKAIYLVIAATTAGVFPSDDTFFTLGDTRAAMLKRFVINITLYELHSRINPRAIPEHRIKLRDDAISLLKSYSNPKFNINAEFLTLKTFGDRKANNMSWNSKDKQSNDY